MNNLNIRGLGDVSPLTPTAPVPTPTSAGSSEPVAHSTPPVTAAPPVSAPVAKEKPVVALKEAKKKASMPIAPILASIGIVLALGAGAYALQLQKQMQMLRKDLALTKVALEEVKSTAQTAQTAASATAKKTEQLDAKATQVESQMNSHFHNLDEYILKTLPTELKKIPTLEARMVEDNKALVNQNSKVGTDLQELQKSLQTESGRLGTVIQVLKNQDSILRTLFPAPEPKADSK
jgi:hypothetical protein